MRFAVIIPSASTANLQPCVEAVRVNEPEAAIVVVSDGLDLKALSFLPRNAPFWITSGVKPFVFARNVNMGIQAARDRFSPDAFVLLNDDALLETPGGFSLLARDAEEHPEYGIISAVTNCSGNPAQRRYTFGLREEPKTLCFVAVLIPARTIDAVGMLDERFIAYGFEDNDYSRRVRNAGLRLGIEDFCFVDHLSLKSSFRGDPKTPADINAGREIYLAKWGSLE
jgi:hypothetical protein